MSAPADTYLKKDSCCPCTLLFCAILLKAFAWPLTPDNYRLHMLSKSLWDTTLVTFLEAMLGCPFMEEFYCKNNKEK
jgi:hypothetical protein